MAFGPVTWVSGEPPGEAEPPPKFRVSPDTPLSPALRRGVSGEKRVLMTAIRPCRNGHDGHRYPNGRCIECRKIQTAAYESNNPNRFEKHRDKMRVSARRWRSENLSWQREYTARKRARIKQAAGLCSETHIAELRVIYDQCPVGMEVDHVVPIYGANVCGLHVPWNLQYLTKEENCRKNNRFDPSA